MQEPTTSAHITVGQDIARSGLDLVTFCADLDRAVRAARPDIDWAVSADLTFIITTIKVEPGWPANYAEVNAIVSPVIAPED